MQIQTKIKAKDIDTLLDEVDYEYLNSDRYMPSEFALTFMNFIKLIGGREGEGNKTPPMHLAMLDKIMGRKQYIANLCYRGSGKTTIFSEIMILYIAVFGSIPGFGKVDGVIFIADSVENGARGLRKNIEFRYHNSEFLQEWIPRAKFTEGLLEFENKDGHKLGVRLFGSKSGLRGTRIYGKRPQICIMDDLLSDDDSKSQVSMEAIKDTVYKGVNHALDPTRRKVIFNGTPFNKDDILVEAIESGAWEVNVWPVCERWPCSREEFRGAWEDRFSYDYVESQYEMAVATGKVSSFNQELMLRLASEEDRLVQDGEIRWYSRKQIMSKRGNFNFYVTTDFATTAKTTSDFSVISVWAYNSNGDWFWIDGVCARQTVDKTLDDLFRLVQEYKPQSVGIETSGQQQAFITLLQREQMNRNIWFNFASNKQGGAPGISVTQDKLTRFNSVVPWFKAGKMYFPEELKKSEIMGHFMGQLSLVTISGIKGKDDCIDTISMLSQLNPWKPSDEVPLQENTKDGVWALDEPDEEFSGLHSYIV